MISRQVGGIGGNSANLGYFMEALRVASRAQSRSTRRGVSWLTFMKAANESIRTSIKRDKRLQRALRTVDIAVGGMHDADVKGNRLAERAQRRVLISSGQRCLDFDHILHYARVDLEQTGGSAAAQAGPLGRASVRALWMKPGAPRTP